MLILLAAPRPRPCVCCSCICGLGFRLQSAALFVHQDDVITVLGLHECAGFARLERKGSLIEFGHMAPDGNQPRSPSPVFAPGVGGILGGQRGKASPLASLS